uniref:Uncharacterized protein n=1 Tax=Glossina pallidipes TaxID=7398 RepID=A0A1A9ZCZ6_GLOPL
MIVVTVWCGCYCRCYMIPELQLITLFPVVIAFFHNFPIAYCLLPIANSEGKCLVSSLRSKPYSDLIYASSRSKKTGDTNKQPPSSSLESTQTSPPHHNTVNTIAIVGRHHCHQQRTTGITHRERVICHSTHQTGVDFANSAASSGNVFM